MRAVQKDGCVWRWANPGNLLPIHEMTIRYTFPRSCRLLKTDDYSSVFNFNRRKNGRYLNVYAKPNFSNQARLGMVVGKKQMRTAVARNFAKRIIREEFRLHRPTLPAMDFVVRVTKAINRTEAHVVRDELIYLFQKTSRCLES